MKWQDSPIHAPLLRLPNDLAPLALECFDCILRYCSDIPMEPELSEVKCVYTVLMVAIIAFIFYRSIKRSFMYVYCPALSQIFGVAR